jgi:RNA-binding protein
MTLTSKQAQELKSLAHHLNPIVLIGKSGLDESQLENIDKELLHHELMKIKFNDYKSQKEELAEKIAEETGSEIIDIIGNTLIIYREHPNPEERQIQI